MSKEIPIRFIHAVKCLPEQDREAVAARAAENYDRIKQLLRSTGMDGVEDLIRDLGRSTFPIEHPHRHHHYPTGLMEHVLGVYDNMVRHAEEFAREGISVDPKDIILVGLLHDVCDAKLAEWDGILPYRHGPRSRGIVEKYLPAASEEVLSAIEKHMWRRSRWFVAHMDDQRKRHPLRALVLLSDSSDAHRFPGRSYFSNE